MKIALAQENPIVGDIAGNAEKMARSIDRAASAGADLVVFSELSVTGYPPRDLLRKRKFIADNISAVESLAKHCTRTAALVGFARPTPAGHGRPLQNVAALLAGGQIRHVHAKTLLPTYDVFDETRYFEPGRDSAPLEICSRRMGLSVCEDLWDAVALGRELYGVDPIEQLIRQGSQIIVNMAASPFQMGKAELREDLFRRQARRSGAAVIYVNQVGGNDELVFDGCSCAVSSTGEILGRAKSFEEDLLMVDLDGGPGRIEEIAPPLRRLSKAIKLGLRDYVRKCGFKSVVLGLSGGIDSAAVAALAADALGPENVYALAMPSRFSSSESLTDAQKTAENLGIHFDAVEIESIHSAYENEVWGKLDGAPWISAASENIQARIRGNIVMAYSNAYGHLPLATGNKSELSTGYCTLYGDMSGGLSPIGDVLKTLVWKLSEDLNSEVGRERIPRAVIDKVPTAELKPNQTDQDKLPPYETLDAILERYIELDETSEQIVEQGFNEKTVRDVVRMVDFAEYKRKQASPVLKVTARAFGVGRRMPIAQRYNGNGKTL